YFLKHNYIINYIYSVVLFGAFSSGSADNSELSDTPFSDVGVVSAFSSLCSSSSIPPSSIFVIAAISSPSSTLMSFTPWVARPSSLISCTGILMVIPLLHVIKRSSFSVTSNSPTNAPVFSVILSVFTPLPPRLVKRYSSMAVRFPYPFSLTTSTVVFFSSFLLTQIMPITSSCSSSTSIPITPMAPLPVARTFSSEKRIALPLLTAIITSQLPSVSLASSN